MRAYAEEIYEQDVKAHGDFPSALYKAIAPESHLEPFILLIKSTQAPLVHRLKCEIMEISLFPQLLICKTTYVFSLKLELTDCTIIFQAIVS